MRNYLIQLLPWVLDGQAFVGDKFPYKPPAVRLRDDRHADPAVSWARPTAKTFPLVDPLPSTDSAAADWPTLFVCFVGTMRSSDSPTTCMPDVGLEAFSGRSLPLTVKDGVGVSQFSARSFHTCSGSVTPQRCPTARV